MRLVIQIGVNCYHSGYAPIILFFKGVQFILSPVTPP